MVTRTKPKETAQIHFDEKVIRDPELEQLLDERETAKQATKTYRSLDKEAKAKIAELGDDPPYRVGRFLITKSTVEAKSVSFETDASTRIQIKLFAE